MVEKRGSFYSYGDVRLGQGRENSKSFLRENPELMAEIDNAVRQQALSGTFTHAYGDSEDEVLDDEEI